MQPATTQVTPESAAHPERIAGVAQRPIDLVHLSKFTMGRRDLEAEILGLFRQQLFVSLERLAAAAERVGDDKAWKEATHTLKGCARGVGAWVLGDATAKAETLTSSDARRAAIDELHMLVSVATGFIDELMEDWHA